MDLRLFSQLDFLPALKVLFKDLEVPMNYMADEPTTAKEILKDTYKDNENFQQIEDVYFLGMVDDAAFEGNKSLEVDKIKSDYDGILIFGVMLKNRPNGLLPTRSQLAEITRAFNREFYYTPVVVVFKYGNYLAFANAERLKYKQEWREGEKAGKVSLLRDIHIEKPHSGHVRILAELQIPTKGTKKVDSFVKLYAYWQEVFNVSLLNKKFYHELSNWYFWAIQQVSFPGEPTSVDAYHRKVKLEDMQQEHRAKNVIRMLTRLLFVWFIKEKKLIPEELFELDVLQKDILNEIYPYHELGLFKERNKDSVYYKAILQNLFFATLNCPVEGDRIDKRKRGFRTPDSNFGTLFLMRYEKYFKDKKGFLSLVNEYVPFLNGGLFECLDERGEGEKKEERIWIDGFSDNLPKGEMLIVPDYLFFGLEEEADLSDIVGISDKKYKKAAVKGLINILKSYKFTITENTPIEEDVALDPEMLGKVFENLLASYNPETKTTARKQTGSFYTPREIVNYMVDESLIAYLKNAVKDWGGFEDDTLDEELHVLTSFDSIVPFADMPELQREIITALSTCSILDPACGSGAFPMGILQKMVHILQKLDPDNNAWKKVQLSKAEQDSKAAFEIEDKLAREERLLEINEAFDQSINDPDYARKLFLIENCIYGVDIQPIATQISKLRFFISLVVEQKVNKEKSNFGIRPLPNLETKFVAANTLIGIKKDGGLFETEEVKKLENELKIVRHKIFSLKSKERKIAWREKDKELREKLSEVLRTQGLPLDDAENLAKWDPYNQNESSDFFDSEWMFGIKEGFDVLIGNPPYHQLSKDSLAKKSYKDYLKNKYKTSAGRLNLFIFFTHEAINLAKKNNGVVSYIIPNTILTQEYYSDTRKKILLETTLLKLVDYDEMPFENAVVENVTFVLKNSRVQNNIVEVFLDNLIERKQLALINQNQFLLQKNFTFNINSNNLVDDILSNKKHRKVSTLCEVNQGIALKGDKSLSLKKSNPEKRFYQLLDGRNINKYSIEWDKVFLDYDLDRIHSCKRKDIFESEEKLFFRRVSRNLIFTYDDNQFFALNTIVVVNKKPSCKERLKVLLAVFNSDLLNYIYQKQYKSTKKVFSEIQARSVKELPIPIINSRYDAILYLLSSILIYKNFNERVFSSVSNAIVNQLYFPEHMNEREIDVLDSVEQDIAEVMKDRDFEKLSDVEKEQVIETLHAKWSHQDNEVRNRIKLFAVRSPEILKPILEN